MANVPFSSSKFGEQLFHQSGSRMLTVGTLGESHGQAVRLGAVIQYACWRHYNANIYYDHRTYANGGTDFAVGGTTTTGTNGLSTQVGQFALRPTDIAFIWSGYNDSPSDSAAAVTVAGNVITSAEACFTAGAKFVVIASIVPWNAHSAIAWQTYNTIIQDYVRQRQGAFFLDAGSVLYERQNVVANGVQFRKIATNAAGTKGSYTADGTHISGYAARKLAPLVADIFERIGIEKRRPRVLFNQGDYVPATNPYANIVGDAGNGMGTAGLRNSDFDTGVAGTGANSRFSLNDNGASLVATPSIITGADGERKQRLTLTGTGATDSTVILGITPAITGVNGGVASRELNMECKIDLTGVSGLCDIILRPLSSTYDSCSWNSGGNQASGLWDDLTTESLFAYHLYNQLVPAGNNPAFTMLLQFSSGTAPAGTIDISSFGAFVVKE